MSEEAQIQELRELLKGVTWREFLGTPKRRCEDYPVPTIFGGKSFVVKYGLFLNRVMLAVIGEGDVLVAMIPVGQDACRPAPQPIDPIFECNPVRDGLVTSDFADANRQNCLKRPNGKPLRLKQRIINDKIS